MTNQLIYGPNEFNQDLVGFTIAQIELAAAELLNIEPGITPVYVDSRRVEDRSNLVVKPEQRVEWMKEDGEKGAPLSDDDRLWLFERFAEIDARIEQLTAKPQNGEPGRKRVMTEVAIFAKSQRDDGKTWKEVFQACRERFPNDDRVNNSDQIRKAVNRLCKQQQKYSSDI